MHIDLDYSNGDQDYFEDCANCCNPIHLNMHINAVSQTLELNVSTDDEQYYWPSLDPVVLEPLF